MAYPHLPADFDEKLRHRLGDGAEFAVGQGQEPRALSAIYRPARLCRRARLRRHGAQRAPPEHLRADAVAQPDRRGADAAHQARQDRHPRQPPAAASQPAARRGRIRDARQHVGRPPDRGLRAGLGAGDVQLQCAVGARRAASSGRRSISSSAPGPSPGRSNTRAGTIPCATSIRGRSRRRQPHPPIWIPGSRSRDTLVEIAKRGYCYFLSSRSHGKETARSQELFAKILEEHGDRYTAVAHGHPDVGLCGGDRRAGAGRSQGRRLVLPQELPQGPSAPRRPPAHLRARHPLHPAGGIPATS